MNSFKTFCVWGSLALAMGIVSIGLGGCGNSSSPGPGSSAVVPKGPQASAQAEVLLHHYSFEQVCSQAKDSCTYKYTMGEDDCTVAEQVFSQLDLFCNALENRDLNLDQGRDCGLEDRRALFAKHCTGVFQEFGRIPDPTPTPIPTATPFSTPIPTPSMTPWPTPVRPTPTPAPVVVLDEPRLKATYQMDCKAGYALKNPRGEMMRAETQLIPIGITVSTRPQNLVQDPKLDGSSYIASQPTSFRSPLTTIQNRMNRIEGTKKGTSISTFEFSDNVAQAVLGQKSGMVEPLESLDTTCKSKDYVVDTDSRRPDTLGWEFKHHVLIACDVEYINPLLGVRTSKHVEGKTRIMHTPDSGRPEEFKLVDLRNPKGFVNINLLASSTAPLEKNPTLSLMASGSVGVTRLSESPVMGYASFGDLQTHVMNFSYEDSLIQEKFVAQCRMKVIP